MYAYGYGYVMNNAFCRFEVKIDFGCVFDANLKPFWGVLGASSSVLGASSRVLADLRASWAYLRAS